MESASRICILAPCLQNPFYPHIIMLLKERGRVKWGSTAIIIWNIRKEMNKGAYLTRIRSGVKSTTFY